VPWTWLASAVGAVLAALCLRDMFHTLWHPSGDGRIAMAVIRSVWSTTRSRFVRGRASALSGPLSLVVVVLLWAAMLIAAFALVYWPHIPEDFAFSSSLDVDDRSALLDAVYVSMVSLATLGFGDIVPTADWLRVVVPIEAFCGFALLTAAVTWAMQVYPVLARRRALALRLATLARADAGGTAEDSGPSVPAVLLHDLAGALAQVRVDIQQYGESVYFRDPDSALSLPRHLPVALALAEAAGRSSRTDVRTAGAVLNQEVDDVARVFAAHFGADDGDTRSVIEALATVHGSG
jgi:Ion channel